MHDTVAKAGRSEPTATKRVTFAFHFNAWKQPVLERYFPDRRFVFLPMHVGDVTFASHWTPRILDAMPCDLLVWSCNAPPAARALAEKHGIPIFSMEDGFIRSVQPNASRTPPLSLAMDSRTPYFDATRPSDLEWLLNTYDFAADEPLMQRARKGIRLLLDSGISKYNGSDNVDPERIYGPKQRKRVLVVGQVEDDASIIYGCHPIATNNDLVRLAALENPDAEIIYKPHPDILSKARTARSDPRDVAHLCSLMTKRVALSDALKTIDHVYTITSLAGFEALLRGIAVTALGCPFYAGWGLTDDRQTNPRRRASVSIEALFAASYILYPLYFDPVTGDRLTFEQVIEQFPRFRSETPVSALSSARYSPPEWRPWGAYGIMGWRHALPMVVAPFIRRIGREQDVQTFRRNPIQFFRELSDPKLRMIGRVLYPFD